MCIMSFLAMPQGVIRSSRQLATKLILCSGAFAASGSLPPIVGQFTCAEISKDSHRMYLSGNVDVPHPFSLLNPSLFAIYILIAVGEAPFTRMIIMSAMFYLRLNASSELL